MVILPIFHSSSRFFIPFFLPFSISNTHKILNSFFVYSSCLASSLPSASSFTIYPPLFFSFYSFSHFLALPLDPSFFFFIICLRHSYVFHRQIRFLSLISPVSPAPSSSSALFPLLFLSYSINALSVTSVFISSFPRRRHLAPQKVNPPIINRDTHSFHPSPVP